MRAPDPSSPTGWSSIDLTLSKGQDGVEPALADADILFSGGGAGTLASVAQDGRTFGLLTEQDVPTPTTSGDTATYPEAQPGIDLVLQARPAGFEQSYLVKSPPKDPLVFDFPLSLKGLTAAVNEAGQLVLTDSGGNVVGQASPAVMFGAKVDPATDEPVDQGSVDLAIISTKDGPILEVAPDPAFFSRPGLAYPVTIDPAPDLSVNVDTYVKSTNPNTSYGTDGQLKSGTPDGTEKDRTLVSFSGTSVLDDTHVLSATLKLWEIHSYSCTASEVDVYEATGAFTSSTTWNTQPAQGTLYASATVAAGYSANCPAAWVNLSTGGASGKTLTDLVQQWAWGTKDPNGFVLRAASETDPQGWKKFSSSEGASNHPTLTVSYDIPPPDASDSWDGDTQWENDILSSPNSYLTDQAGGICANPDDPKARYAYAKYPFRKFTPLGATDPIDMNLNEFDPPILDAQHHYPVLILIHGGGWVAGCRQVVQKEAQLLAGQVPLQRKGSQGQDIYVAQPFIVFTINYRLACNTGAYDEFPDSALPELCGWRWDTSPEPQAAIHDIEEAIRWVKGLGTDYNWETEPEPPANHFQYWDGENIFVLGASAGGNLATTAAADAGADSDILPNAVGILSGFPEFDRTDSQDQDWPCDSGSSGRSDCWTHVNNYLHCDRSLHPDPDCDLTQNGGNNRYFDASPTHYAWDYEGDGTGTPPMFVANAGGPIGGTNKDLSPLQLAVDFDSTLRNSPGYVEGTNLKLCIVDSSGHATGFLDKWNPSDQTKQRHCENDTGVEVIESLVTFFQSFLVQ